MPDHNIVIFSESTLVRFPQTTVLDRIIFTPLLNSQDTLECYGMLRNFQRSNILLNTRECPYKVDRLKSLTSDFLVSFEIPKDSQSNGSEKFEALGRYARVLPNPHLVAIMCHLLRAMGWHVELASPVFAQSDRTALNCFKQFYTAELPQQRDEKTLENSRKPGLNISERDYLNIDKVDDVRARLEAAEKLDSGCYIDTIVEIIKARFDLASDADLKTVKILFVAQDKAEEKAINDGCKKIGIPEKNVTIVVMDPYVIAFDPYRHFYYTLARAYDVSLQQKQVACTDPDILKTVLDKINDPGVRLAADFLPEQIAEFKQRVLGARFFGNPSLASRCSFAGAVSSPDNRLRGEKVYSAAAAPDSTSIAVGYRYKVLLHNFLRNPNPLHVRLDKGGKPYAMQYNPLGTGLFVVGKCIHFIDVNKAELAVAPLPIKIEANERVVSMEVDHLNGLHMIIHQRVGKGFLQRVYLPFPYRAARKLDENRVAMRSNTLGEAELANFCDVAVLNAKFGKQTTMYSLSLLSPNVLAVGTPIEDILSLKDTSKLHTDTDAIVKFDSSCAKAAKELASIDWCNVKIASYRLDLQEEGFVLAIVDVVGQLKMYKVFKQHIRLDLAGWAAAPRDRDPWKLEALKLDGIKPFTSPVTTLQFTPNCCNLLCHVMRTGQEKAGAYAQGDLFAVRVPTIGLKSESRFDPISHVASQATTCGVPVKMVTLLKEDRTTPMAILFGEKDSIVTIELRDEMYR